MKKMLSIILIITMLMGMSVNVFAVQSDDNIAEIDRIYNSGGMKYFDHIPESLLVEYSKTIDLADMYLEKFYGEGTMLSTDKDFVLDDYCNGILLGLILDLEDESMKNELIDFTVAAAKLYILPQDQKRTAPESPTLESTNKYYQEKELRLNASGYDVNSAVDYAYKWTEEGKTLSNPDYHRYTTDCTNFISQVLHEGGGISQVQGDREADSSWFYDWGLFSRPSYTWSAAHNLYQHLKNHSSNASRVTSTADLNVGDLISFDIHQDGTFHINHTAIITKKTGNSWSDIYLSYHSSDREDYPASNLINAGYVPYGWSID